MANIGNFNEQIRKKIVSDLEDIIIDKYCTIDEAIEEYQEHLYSKMDNNDKKIYQSYLCSIVYLDAYKIYSYKLKKLIAKPLEIDILYQLSNIKDYDDLKSEISANPPLFAKMIQASYDFNESSPLSKTILFKSLNEEENEKLSIVSEIHSIDLEVYNKEVTIQDIIDNYKYQKKYFESIMTISFNDGIILSTTSFINELRMVSKDNVDKLIRDMVMIDLNLCKYLSNILENNNDLIKAINLYENNSLINVINYVLNNLLYLKTIIQRIIDVYVNRSYKDIDIDDEIMNKLKLIKK